MGSVPADRGRPPVARPRSLRTAVGSAVRFVFGRSESFARARYIRYLRREEQRFPQPPVFVYQMGKVGSTTIKLSLASCDLGRRVYQIHFLDPQHVRDNERQRKAYPPDERRRALKRVWESQYLHERLSSDPGDEPWRVITLVRDPVARNVATFFEHVEILDQDDSAWHVRALSYDFELTVPKNDLGGLEEMFLERCRHHQVLDYFNNEFNRLWGVDVFAEPFAADNGHQTYRTSRMAVLLIRLEDLNRVGADAVGAFLGRPDIRLVDKNVGSRKPYAELYSRFKKEVRLPEAYLDKMYRSQFATHFYTPAELERFRSRWSGGGAS